MLVFNIEHSKESALYCLISVKFHCLNGFCMFAYSVNFK